MRQGEISEEQIKRYYESRLQQELRPNDKGEATGRCPFHDDKSPSLSVNVKKGVWKCHAGCGGGSIFAFEARIAQVDQVEARRRVSEFFDGPIGDKEAVAEYNYTDEQGELLFQKIRYSTKKFKQRRPDPIDGWIWNRDGVRTVLYRLTEVVKAEEIFVVEGEKDADRLASLGLTATTNPDGAGKWLPEFNQYFHGKNVVVLPDNDEPGRRHAQMVLQNLQSVAATLKLVELPGLPPKGDVSDWLDAGHSVDELRQMVASKAVWGSASVSPLLSQIPNVWRLEVPPVEWVVEHLLPLGCVTLLTGAPDVGKTWMGLSLGKAVVHGLPFLDRIASARKVFYCDRENPLAVTRQRLDMLGFEENPDFHYWGLHCAMEPPLLGEGDPGLYVQLARAFPIRPVFIFDTLVRFHGAQSENAASDMAPVMAELRKVASAGAAVVVLHHRGKSDSSAYRGSSDILAAVDLALVLSKDTESGPWKLGSAKNRLDESFSITLSLNPSAGGFHVTADPQMQMAATQRESVRAFVEASPGKCQKEIVDALKGHGISVHQIRRILEEVTGTDWHTRRGAHGRTEYYPGPAAEADDIF